jgi:signal peptidase II
MYKKGMLFIFILVSLDQLTKYVAQWLYQGQDFTLIPFILEIGYAENRGMSFGLLQDQTLLFMVITVIALAIFLYLYKDISFINKKVYTLAIILFIAGTLGNAIDRLVLQYVIDFMHFPFLEWPLNVVGLPNFYNNFADMYLSLGLVLFATDLFFLEKKREKNG